MSGDPIVANARALEAELAWLSSILDARFRAHFAIDQAPAVELPPPPELDAASSPYAALLASLALTPSERLAVILALAPHVRPRLLDVFFTRNQTFDRPFTEFGGARELPGGFTPTFETLAFLLGGEDLEVRFRLHALVDPGHPLTRRNILQLAGPQAPSLLATPLTPSDEAVSLATTGRPRRPTFGASFPAQLVETRRDWDDLVLHPGTRAQIEELQAWIEHGETLLRDWGMARTLRPGYRCLFYGPPGTGKTMTACLLGKSSGRDVYKIDLSLTVSKYIGETEKNLARIFDQAEHKGWILFFDEADALFGKRSETRDAHDRYANQEVSFLLQRIETFDGLAILASNLRDNLDAAFTRRFESIIYFPMPRPEERARLWSAGFSSAATLEEALDLDELARQHALSGGAIMNVVRHASMQALRRGERTIAAHDVQIGIRREYAKEGKAG